MLITASTTRFEEVMWASMAREPTDDSTAGPAVSMEWLRLWATAMTADTGANATQTTMQATQLTGYPYSWSEEQLRQAHWTYRLSLLQQQWRLRRRQQFGDQGQPQPFGCNRAPAEWRQAAGIGPYIDVLEGSLQSESGGAVEHTDESFTEQDVNTTEPDDDDERDMGGGHDIGGGHDMGTCNDEGMSDDGGYQDEDGPWALMSDEDMARAAQEAAWQSELAPCVETETEVDSGSDCPWQFNHSGDEDFHRRQGPVAYGSPEDPYESD